MISAVAAILAARLAAGSLLAVGLLRWRHPAPPAFARFIAAGAAVALVVSLALGRGRPEFPVWVVLFVGAAGLWLLDRRSPGSRRVLAGFAFALGLFGAIAPPLLAGAGENGLFVAAAASLSGAALLGATAAVMVLGHWYLVDPALSIRPLVFGASAFLAAAALRILVAGLALAVSGAAALGVSAPSDLIYSTSALFFSFRAVTGLAAPLALAVLVHRTARIRSTQSATGLLYVALILVLFGELTAVFLETITTGALV